MFNLLNLILSSLGLPKELTKDGLEISFATNHLGPFLLTTLLLGKSLIWLTRMSCFSRFLCSQRLSFLSSIPDLLKDSAPARIVNLSSFNHKRGKVDFSHYYGKNLSGRMDQIYNHTKLHIVLCTKELAHRLQGTGGLKLSFQIWSLFVCLFVTYFLKVSSGGHTGVVANSVNPGIVNTEVLRYYPFLFRYLLKFIGFFFFKASIIRSESKTVMSQNCFRLL